MERGNLQKENCQAEKHQNYVLLIIASAEGKATYLLGILKKKFLCRKEVGKDDLGDPF